MIINDLLTSNDINKINGKYYLCSWTNHNIIIFVNINKNNIEIILSENVIYDVGIINCGEYSNFQNFNNNDLCNSMIIFENIAQERIINLFKIYKKYIKNINVQLIDITNEKNINQDNMIEFKVSQINNSTIIQKKQNTNYYFHISNIIIMIICLMPSMIYILLDIMFLSQK